RCVHPRAGRDRAMPSWEELPAKRMVNLPATLACAQSSRTTSVCSLATQTAPAASASLNPSSAGFGPFDTGPTWTVRRVLPVRGSAWLTVAAASSGSHRLPRPTAARAPLLGPRPRAAPPPRRQVRPGRQPQRAGHAVAVGVHPVGAAVAPVD